jgi:hypothetical protein
MAVSKRLRYEVLRRDNHACRYCGATAPEAKLTVDHVQPSALGGSDEPANLVTACSSCNSGKTSSSPSESIVADVSDDALRWAQAMKEAASIQRRKLLAREEYCNGFLTAWNNWHFGEDPTNTLPVPASWENTLEAFFAAGIEIEIVLGFIKTTMARDKVSHDDRFRYFCGCCWRYLDQRQEIARGLIAEEETPSDSPCRWCGDDTPTADMVEGFCPDCLYDQLKIAQKFYAMREQKELETAELPGG